MAQFSPFSFRLIRNNQTVEQQKVIILVCYYFTFLIPGRRFSTSTYFTVFENYFFEIMVLVVIFRHCKLWFFPLLILASSSHDRRSLKNLRNMIWVFCRNFRVSSQLPQRRMAASKAVRILRLLRSHLLMRSSGALEGVHPQVVCSSQFLAEILWPGLWENISHRPAVKFETS